MSWNDPVVLKEMVEIESAARSVPPDRRTEEYLQVVADAEAMSRSQNLAHATTGPHQRIVDAIAWWFAVGQDRPTRTQVAFVAGYKPNTGTFNTYLGALSTAGLIDYPDRGRIELTEAGKQLARRPPSRPSQDDLQNRVHAILSGPQSKILTTLIDCYPEPVSRDELAERSGYQPNTGTFNTYLGSLSTLDIISYPQRRLVQASEWLFP